MEGARPGRPLTPLNPDASAGARLGAEIRSRRLAERLTLRALGDIVGYSPQHVSEVERAKVTPSRTFIAACDRALSADGALLDLLPAVVDERKQRCDERTVARRTTADPALRCATAHSEVGDEDVDTSRRGLLGAGATAALGGLGISAAPAPPRDVDPGLPAHWTDLLNLFGRHNQAFGPRTVQGAVRRELRLIAEHRAAAHGDLRVALMRVEACWSEFGSWLAHDCGDWRGRDALLNRALHLAREADYGDMVAWAHARLADWSDAPTALGYAEAGFRTPRASTHTRALCATRAAYAHARLGDAESTKRSIAEAERLVADASPPLPPPTSGMTELLVRRWEACCWSLLKPKTAIGMFDDILRDQPRAWVNAHGLYLAYLANACADAGELDRARAEGSRALAVTKATRSATASRELQRLGAALRAA